MGDLAFVDVMRHHISYTCAGDMSEAFNWCSDTLGPYGVRWKIMNNRTVFCFHYEEDAIFFKLKFG